MIKSSEMEYLSVDIEDRIATVTMNRAPVNAVNQDMYGEIRSLFGDFDAWSEAASVVILTSSGRHFCAGNDLHEFMTMSPANGSARMRLVREAFWSIHDCPVPTIGSVKGAALGTGLAIAASCDLLVCAESATFGVPEVSVGVMGGAKHLARLLPQSLVRLLYFTAEPMAARDLMHYGAVVSVVPDDELVSASRALAGRIARHSNTALRYAKESLNQIEFMDLKSGYEYEQLLTVKLSGMPDAKEALAASIEGRHPVSTPSGSDTDYNRRLAPG
jgi:enoyl-CoA hydratase